MTSFNPIQLKTINEYRVSHNLGYVISDEEVARKIIEEMNTLGVSYKGFETLISEIGSKPVTAERERERERVKASSVPALRH